MISLNGFVIGSQGQDKTVADSLVYDEALLSEFEDFIDSIAAPKSTFLFSVGAGTQNFQYRKTGASEMESHGRIVYAPSAGYFHKDGLGLNVSAALIREEEGFNAYQWLLTGSYDYLKSMKVAGGFSLTHYFTKDSLTFYTSPLENELSAYIALRGMEIKPSLTASYGWGNSTKVEQRDEYLQLLQLRTGYTTETKRVNVTDFSLTASLRHDKYWHNLLGDRGRARVSPQISVTGGTQRFGFNQSSNSYVSNKRLGFNRMYDSGEVQLEDRSEFGLLSATAFLKSEFSFGKFFIQPQLALDYYFPAEKDNLRSGFNINAGFIF